jgi:hypothetical protein
MKAQILKQLTAQGVALNVGDIVDVSTWRHAKTLQSNRYIKILDVEPTQLAKPVAKKVEEPQAEVPVVEEKPKAKKEKVAE